LNNINLFLSSILILSLSLISCSEENVTDTTDGACSSSIEVDTSRGDCTENLAFTPQFNMSITGDIRTISTNNIPDHAVGLFGNSLGSLNPNPISEQNNTYQMDETPSISGNVTQLLGNNGPAYNFGVLLNGVELDPVAAEPWPHEGFMAPNVNWEWNLEATMVQIGLDCNNAHVQPSGKYHYHANPTLYLQNINVSNNEMTLIGYAADGFPIYYKYGFADANDSTSSIIELLSSYQLKMGDRPGDGDSAPCGQYTGIYSADFEYVTGLGDLDECNGRSGITPEFPNGTYYYVR
jgi:hypothetical protein